MAIRRIRFVCWITKATHTHTHTHTEYEVLSAFPQQHWLRERAILLCYTYIACVVVAETVCLLLGRN